MNNNDIIDFYIDFNAHKLNILEPFILYLRSII